MLRVILLTMAFASSFLVPQAAPAQSDWSVSATSEREQKIIRRTIQMMLENPGRRSLVGLLVRRTGTGEALNELVGKLRLRAETSGSWNEWLVLGHLEAVRGHVADARLAYGRGVAAAPDNPVAHTALAEFLAEIGEADRARSAAERALELASELERPKLLRRLADLAMRDSDFMAAADWLERLAQAQPRERALQIELAEAYTRSHRYNLALKAYERAVSLSARGKLRAEALIELAGLHLQMQNPLDAERRLREALSLIAKKSTSNWMRREAWVKLVDAKRASGQLAEAYDELTREWRRPSLHDALMLADLADELGRTSESIKWTERALEVEPGNIEARRRLIARLDPVADAARIETLYAELIALRPDDVAERLERIEWTFFRSERPSEALDALRALEKEWAQDPAAMVAIARSWLRLGVPDIALRIHERLDTSAPKDALHLEAYAELLLDLGRREEGCQVLDRLIALEPDRPIAALRAAELAARHKAPGYAMERLEQVVAAHPQQLDARQRLAALYESEERWADALTQWEFLFDAGKDHVAAPIVAIIRRTVFIGDTPLSPDEQALSRWETRFAADRSVRSGALLVEVRKAAGKPAAGRALARELIDRDPAKMDASDRKAWFAVAQRYRDLYDLEDSLALLERMATAFPEWRPMLNHEAVQLAAQLPEKQADEAFVRLTETAPWDGFLYATIGLHWSSHGQPDRALPYLLRARELNPQSSEASFELVHVLRKLGKSDKAWGVLMDMIDRTRAATATLDAAFAALDFAESDAQLLELESKFESLRGRVDVEDLRGIAVAVYYALYTYGEDRERVVRLTRERAGELVVGALASPESGDVALAAELLPFFETKIEALARKTWPANGMEWSDEMINAVGNTSDPWFHQRFIAATRSERREVRWAAMFALGAGRAESAVPRLVEAWRDKQSDDLDRRAVAAALGRIDVGAARAPLRDQVQATSWEDRQLAVWGLGQGRSREAATLLRGSLTDGEHRVARLAATMLRRMPADVGLRELLRARISPNERERSVADYGLRSSPAADWWTEKDRAFVVYVPLLQSVEVRAEPLAAALRGHEDLVAEVVRSQFGEQALAFLVDVAEETDAQEDAEGASSLRRIVRGLRPQLRDAAVTNDGLTLAYAAELLPRAERPDDVSVVVQAMERLPADRRAKVSARLTAYPWHSVRRTLLRSLAGDAQRRAAALRALAAYREATRDPDVLEAARDSVRQTRDDAQVAAIELLGGADDTESVEVLAKAFEASGPRARAAIRAALGAIDNDAARAELRTLTVKPERPVCAGDPDDLSELLRDACRGAVFTSEF